MLPLPDVPLDRPHRRALTYGTFDLFHHGHFRLLKRIKQLAAHLIVGVSTDEFNRKKGKQAAQSFEERVELLRHLTLVDEVIAETGWEQKLDDVRRLEVDLFVMGDDWRGQFDFLAPHCRVLYLERTPVVSSTTLRQVLTAAPAPAKQPGAT